MTAGKAAKAVRKGTRERTAETRSAMTPVSAISEESQMIRKKAASSSRLSREPKRPQAIRARVPGPCPTQTPSITVPQATAPKRLWSSELSSRISARVPSTFTSTGRDCSTSIMAGRRGQSERL
jgi:hypothetical protein